MELGFAPGAAGGEGTYVYVFATAEDGVGLGEFAEFGTQGEGGGKSLGKAELAVAGGHQGAGGGHLVGRDKAGNAAFELGFFEAADAGGFADAVDAFDRCLLKFVHLDKP